MYLKKIFNFSATLEDKKSNSISAPPPDFDSWADDFMSNKVPDKSAVVKQSIQPIKTVKKNNNLNFSAKILYQNNFLG